MSIDDQNYKDVNLFTRSLNYYRMNLTNNLDVEKYRDIKWLMIRIITSPDFYNFLKDDVKPYIGITLKYLRQEVRYSDLGVDGMFQVSLVISYCKTFIDEGTKNMFSVDFI